MLSRSVQRAIIVLLCISTFLIIRDIRNPRDEYEEDINSQDQQFSPKRQQETFMASPSSTKYPQHPRVQNGLIETNMEGRHPILDLIEKGEQKWNEMISRQSKSLSEAVDEYERRYGRPPPLGFDKWWKFVKDNGVILVDEYDQIHRDIEPYFALSPRIFQSRVDDLAANLPFSFSLIVSGGSSSLRGERATSPRATDIADLVEPFAQWLPDLQMHASDHDRGNIVLGQDQLDKALELVTQGEYLSTEQLKYYEDRNRNSQPNLRSACHPNSNAIKPTPETNSSHTFLADPLSSMNYCNDPSLIKLHGTWSFDHAHETRLVPMWVHCKWEQDHSFLLPALPGFEDIIRDPSKLTPWSERTDSRLFWRARSTGVDFHTGWNWRAAHRIRLHLFATDKNGTVELLQEGKREPGPDDPPRGPLRIGRPLKNPGDPQNQIDILKLSSYPRSELIKKYLDVGLVGPLIQCYEPPPFCETVANELGFLDAVPVSRGQDAKFVIDVDGNGWSQRFARLLSSGSVVLKSTVFPEWNTNWLIPYYHYIPIKVDYTDIFDTMAFFVGWPDGTVGHDDLAEKISTNALHFIKHHWRREDAQAYMFRLLLEYARLASSDREAASYQR